MGRNEQTISNKILGINFLLFLGEESEKEEKYDRNSVFH